MVAACKIAEGLRRLREEAGSPPYSALASAAGYSASWLAWAASGKSLPRLELTLAYVRACGGNVEEWTRRWTTAATEFYGITQDPDPALATTAQELAAELTSLMRLSDFWSLRTLEAASRKNASTELSRSMLSRTLTGQQVPSEEGLSKFLQVCHVPPQQQQRWLEARRRIATVSLTNVVSFRSTVSGSSPSPDIATVLYDELRPLRRGRGLDTTPLSIGPMLTQLCNINADDPAHLAREKLISMFIRAADPLPHDLKLIARASFAFEQGPWSGRFLRDRLRWCHRELLLDERTLRRRLDEAQHRLVERMLIERDHPDFPPRKMYNEG